MLYYAKCRCLCTWRWGIEALKSIQGPLQKGNPSLTGRVGSPHTHLFSWTPVENSWSKGLGVLCHQWRQPPLEVLKDFCHLILMMNHSLEVLIFLHQPQWKLEFTNPRTVCGPPKELAYFSYGDVRNRLSWFKAKQTYESWTSHSGQSPVIAGSCTHTGGKITEKMLFHYILQEKSSSALGLHPASICNLMLLYQTASSQVA